MLFTPLTEEEWREADMPKASAVGPALPLHGQAQACWGVLATSLCSMGAGDGGTGAWLRVGTGTWGPWLLLMPAAVSGRGLEVWAEEWGRL